MPRSLIATFLVCALLPAPQTGFKNLPLSNDDSLRGLSAEESAVTHSRLAAGLEEAVVVLHPDDPKHGNLFKRLFWTGTATIQDKLAGLASWLQDQPKGVSVLLGIVPRTVEDARELSAAGLQPLMAQSELWGYLNKAHVERPHSASVSRIASQLSVPVSFSGLPDLKEVWIVPAQEGMDFYSPRFSESFKKMVGSLSASPKSVSPDKVFGQLASSRRQEPDLLFLIGIPYGLPNAAARDAFVEKVQTGWGIRFPDGKILSQEEARKRAGQQAVQDYEEELQRLVTKLSWEISKTRQKLKEQLKDRLKEIVQPVPEKREELEEQIANLTPEKLVPAHFHQGQKPEKGEVQIREALKEAQTDLERKLRHLSDRASPLAQHLYRVNRSLELRRWEELGDLCKTEMAEATRGRFAKAPLGNSDELRQMDALVLKIQDLLQSGFPGPPAQEQFLRTWQAYAVGFLAALGKLSSRSALAFLQDPSALELNAWGKWVDTWWEAYPWKLEPDRPLWVDTFRVLSWMSRSEQGSGVGALDWKESIESGENTPQMFIKLIKKMAGSSSEGLLPLEPGRVMEVFRAVRDRWDAIPQELKLDLLLRRPAAVWNLSAAFMLMVSAVAKELGWEVSAGFCRRTAEERLRETHSLDPRYPLWMVNPMATLKEERQMADFLSEVNRMIDRKDWEGLVQFKKLSSPPGMFTAIFGGDYELGKESVRLLNETVQAIHGALHQDLPDPLRKDLRMVQNIAARYLSSSGRMTEPSARLFAEDPLAAHGLVWFVQHERWKQKLRSTKFSPLSFDIMVGNGELSGGNYVGAYGLLLQVSRPDRFDDAPVRDIWRREETLLVAKGTLQWMEQQKGAQQGAPPVDINQVVQKYGDLIAQIPEPPAPFIEGVLLKRRPQILNANLVFQELFIRVIREFGLSQAADAEEENLQRFLSEWVNAYSNVQLWWPWPNQQAGLEEESKNEAEGMAGIPLRGMTLLEQNLRPDMMVKAIWLKYPWATAVKFLEPFSLGQEFQTIQLDGPGKTRNKGIRDVLKALYPRETYALYRNGPVEIWAIPQPVLLQKSPEDRIRKFRTFLREAAVGSDREKGRADLIKRFGAAAPGEGGVDLRVSPQGEVYLFSIQMGNRSRWVPVSLPRRYRNQVVRIIPRLGPEWELMLDLYRLQPTRLIRQVQWNPETHWFRRVGSRRQDWINEIPEMPVSSPAFPVRAEQSYPLSRIAGLTGIDPEVVDELRQRGNLFQDNQGRVPGDLVAAMAGTMRQINREEYPVVSLRDFIGWIPSYEWLAKRGVDSSKILIRGKIHFLNRRDFSKMVLIWRSQKWIHDHVGGFVGWPAMGKALEIPFTTLQSWVGAPPYFDGYPLWVQLGSKRYPSRKGLEGLLLRQSRILARVQEKGEVVLIHELKSRYRNVDSGELGRLYRDTFRVIQEFGIPFRVLEHPLSPVRELFVIPKNKLSLVLDEVGKKSEGRKRWTIRSIRKERNYSIPSVAPVLGLDPVTVEDYVLKGKIRGEFSKLGMHFIPGVEVIRLYKERKGSAGLEEGPEGAEAPLNLKTRFMYGADYGWGVEHAPVLEIQELNQTSDSEPPWNMERFNGYSQMEHALVVKDLDRDRVAGFLVFERNVADEEDVIPEPDQVQILHWGVHPDYWESGAVEKELVLSLQEQKQNRGVPIVMRVHERDRSSQEMLSRLGFFGEPARDHWIKFVLLSSEGKRASEESLDLRVQEIWNQAASGEFSSLREASIEVLRILERAGEGVPFTNWRDAWQVLTLADDEIGLGAAVAFRLFARRAMQMVRTDQNPWPELARQMELFRNFAGLTPSDYLMELWKRKETGAGPSAGFGTGLEELPEKLVNRLREETETSVTSPVLVADRDGLPQLSRAHRLTLPKTPLRETLPLVLVEEGLLSKDLLGQFERWKWPLQQVPPENLTRAGLSGWVRNAMMDWQRPVLLIVGSKYEEAVRELSGYDSRLTAVVLDPGWARHKALFSYLTQILQLPGRFFRLEYVVETGFDEWIAVSTQL
ncbi:MAG: hypothetical protein HY211_08170 [Candidatus Omnitrophica bacterium]|nr:hypothetical protein [Candidatus Omnitrophota bacterium]